MKIVINDKTYGSGKHALNLLKALEKVKQDIVVCLQPTDVHLACKTKIEVWAQHVDPIRYGSHTGWILPENIKQHGVKGTLINHSEHPVSYRDMKRIVKRCREVKLKTMILVPTAKEVRRVRKLKPDFIGVEPPELIGSKKHSVASKPELIEDAVKYARDIPLLIGAGVKTSNDLLVGKLLKAKGVLISSAVVKAKDPLHALQTILRSPKKSRSRSR